MMRHYWFRFKRFILPYPLGFVGKYGMKLLLSTCKMEVSGLHHLEQMASKKAILVLWHNRMAIICEFFQRHLPKRHYAAFLSKSRDGEPIAQVLARYPGATSIRVAHSMRHQALHAAIDYLNTENGLLVFTPDGPKGPCYKVKPGILHAAKESGAPVIAFSWEADRFWEFKTWDKFRLPKPFSTIKVTLSLPMQLDASLDRDSASALLEQTLNDLAL
jgi:lysophospholipid acyltransferase (LPLAT)-like uncharacterized protein